MQCVVVPVHRFRFRNYLLEKITTRFIIGVHLPTSLPLLHVFIYLYYAWLMFDYF